MKKKYEVVIPWNGVTRGQILELDSVHPSLEANVRLVVAEQRTESVPESKKIVADAKAEAKKIIDDAKAEAGKVTDAALAEAEKIVADAKSAAPKGELTPAKA